MDDSNGNGAPECLPNCRVKTQSDDCHSSCFYPSLTNACTIGCTATCECDFCTDGDECKSNCQCPPPCHDDGCINTSSNTCRSEETCQPISSLPEGQEADDSCKWNDTTYDPTCVPETPTEPEKKKEEDEDSSNLTSTAVIGGGVILVGVIVAIVMKSGGTAAAGAGTAAGTTTAVGNATAGATAPPPAQPTTKPIFKKAPTANRLPKLNLRGR